MFVVLIVYIRASNNIANAIPMNNKQPQRYPRFSSLMSLNQLKLPIFISLIVVSFFILKKEFFSDPNHYLPNGHTEYPQQNGHQNSNPYAEEQAVHHFEALIESMSALNISFQQGQVPACAIPP